MNLTDELHLNLSLCFEMFIFFTVKNDPVKVLSKIRLCREVEYEAQIHMDSRDHDQCLHS